MTHSPTEHILVCFFSCLFQIIANVFGHILMPEWSFLSVSAIASAMFSSDLKRKYDAALIDEKVESNPKHSNYADELTLAKAIEGRRKI